MKSLVVTASVLVLISACGGSDDADSDDDDDDTELPILPPETNGDTDLSPDGTWRTGCVFVPDALIGQNQIREYVRKDKDTAYITNYFNDTACSESSNSQFVLRGTTEFIQDAEDAVFGVSAKAVRFTPTEFYLGGILVDTPVDPFNDLVYVDSVGGLLLGNSTTNDEVTDIPAALDWGVIYRNQGEPEFPQF
ncbi:MAG: hypothetical protein KTR32_23230 [Granulosicoccus sp.]|nr:hypothetical protein [Granulosicoccus sp.]